MRRPGKTVLIQQVANTSFLSGERSWHLPHPRVTIDGSSLGSPQSNQYEFEVNGVFKTMKLNRVGALLIQEITRNLRIQPYVGPGVNADATTTNPRAAEVAGRQMYGCRTALPQTDAAGNPIRGTGGGSDVIIHFTPAQRLTSGIADHQKGTIPAAFRRDESLFHEMVHAVREMLGVRNCSIGAPGFNTKEEVWSIMTTNIYCSAWNRPLRRDHHGHATITAAEVSSYFQRFEVMIGHMCRDLPRFTRAVSQIDYIPFNPFREHYRRHP
jgi:hypothetical protein